MKICAMCGRKIVNAMVPFQIMIPTTGVKVDPIDSCGRCFMLTRMNDELQKANRVAESMKPKKSQPYAD